jgi:hypothetical protein
MRSESGSAKIFRIQMLWPVLQMWNKFQPWAEKFLEIRLQNQQFMK